MSQNNTRGNRVRHGLSLPQDTSLLPKCRSRASHVKHLKYNTLSNKQLYDAFITRRIQISCSMNLSNYDHWLWNQSYVRLIIWNINVASEFDFAIIISPINKKRKLFLTSHERWTSDCIIWVLIEVLQYCMRQQCTRK